MRVLPLILLLACRTNDKLEEGDPTPDTAGLAVDGDGDGYDTSEDCDDADGGVHPGVAEICDGIDNDCDGTADEDVTDTFYADADGDGFGSVDATIDACEAPAGYVAVGSDCDDADAESYPGAPERCDGLDNDCDTAADEDVTSLWYADVDADGYGDPMLAAAACDPQPGFVADNSDCDDTDSTSFPGGVEVCDERDNDCDGQTDEGVTTTYYADIDGDGYGVDGKTAESCDPLTGYAAVAGDCDDAEAGINPGAAEECDAIDNDCDAQVDEGGSAGESTFYADGDGDGYGDAGSALLACEPPAGHVSDSTDCDDAAAGTHPGAAEVCDDVDQDCDGAIDDNASDFDTFYADDDGDGYGDAAEAAGACDQPGGYVANDDDCDDGATAVSPAGAEVCNGVDDDCDGAIDDSASDFDTFYADSDGDGFGDPAATTAACGPPAGYLADADDCDDTDAGINPAAAEVCDEVDQDCDGSVDEGASDSSTFYADDDGDSYGDPSAAASACDAPPGYVANDDDCDDNDDDTYPSAAEICDGEDDSCDGAVDEGLLGSGAACAAESCAAIRDAGDDGGDGYYYLDGPVNGVFQAYCDMTTDGGGWTLIGSVVNEGSRGWGSYDVWTDTTAFGAIADAQAADFKSEAFADVAADDVLIATDEYAFAFYSLAGGDTFAAFIAEEYDTSACSQEFLKSGADWWSSDMTAAQAALQSFLVRPLDTNASCFPNGNENAIIGVQLAECCWVPGLGNTPNGYPTWETYDLSLLQLSRLQPTACTPGVYPCNEAGYLNPNAYNCYDESCKVTWAEIYVR